MSTGSEGGGGPARGCRERAATACMARAAEGASERTRLHTHAPGADPRSTTAVQRGANPRLLPAAAAAQLQARRTRGGGGGGGHILHVLPLRLEALQEVAPALGLAQLRCRSRRARRGACERRWRAGTHQRELPPSRPQRQQPAATHSAQQPPPSSRPGGAQHLHALLGAARRLGRGLRKGRRRWLGAVAGAHVQAAAPAAAAHAAAAGTHGRNAGHAACGPGDENKGISRLAACAGWAGGLQTGRRADGTRAAAATPPACIAVDTCARLALPATAFARFPTCSLHVHLTGPPRSPGPPRAASMRCFSISCAFFFIRSLVSAILDCGREGVQSGGWRDRVRAGKSRRGEHCTAPRPPAARAAVMQCMRGRCLAARAGRGCLCPSPAPG